MTNVVGAVAESENCILHPFETTNRVCHDCGHWHCDGCLVSPWGPRKPSLCVACAIGRSGVRRSSGGAQARSAKEIRQIEKAERRQQRDESRQPVVVTANGLTRVAPEDQEAGAPRRSLLGRLRSA